MRESNSARSDCQVWIRADADPTIGFGHVSRTTAFAQAMQLDAVVLTRTPEACAVYPHLFRKSTVRPIPETVSFANEPSWILGLIEDGSIGPVGILDHYNIDCEYETNLQRPGLTLFAFDDFAIREIHSDYVLNTSVQKFDRSLLLPFGRSLAGLSYSVVRTEFQEEQQVGHRNQVLVVLGGGIATDDLQKMVRVLRSSPLLTGCRFVLPGMVDAAVFEGQSDVLVAGQLTPAELARRFMQSRLVVCSASTVALEACATSVPVVAVCTVENQMMMGRTLADTGICVVVSSADEFAPTHVHRALAEAEHKSYSRARKELQGERSRQRKRTRDLIAWEYSLQLEQAQKEDARLYFDWANDAEVRRASLNQDSIEWESHVDWFQRRIVSDTAWLYKGMFNGTPVGQIRFERIRETTLLLSYSVDAHWRGKGLGPILVRKGIKYLLHTLEEDNDCSRLTVLAQVRSGNVASVRLFRTLGFAETFDSSVTDNLQFTCDLKATA